MNVIFSLVGTCLSVSLHWAILICQIVHQLIYTQAMLHSWRMLASGSGLCLLCYTWMMTGGVFPLIVMVIQPLSLLLLQESKISAGHFESSLQWRHHFKQPGKIHCRPAPCVYWNTIWSKGNTKNYWNILILWWSIVGPQGNVWRQSRATSMESN